MMEDRFTADSILPLSPESRIEFVGWPHVRGHLLGGDDV